MNVQQENPPSASFPGWAAPRHEDIQLLAYQLWKERGCPLGTPEVDWFDAEEKLAGENRADSQTSTILTAAKVVGSALGAASGLVNSVAGLLSREKDSE